MVRGNQGSQRVKEFEESTEEMTMLTLMLMQGKRR